MITDKKLVQRIIKMCYDNKKIKVPQNTATLIRKGNNMKPAIREINAKSIITKSNLPVGDYCANPYTGCTHACKYCYAEFMKRFTNHMEPWGKFLDVKQWPVIRHPEKYNGKAIFIGSVTDPYNPQEETYQRTRALLEQLKGSNATISIATKSDLVLRDLNLIKTFSNIRISWSINTLDENFHQDMDNAVSIDRRLKAMKIFHDEGIPTACFISPIFPGITTVKDIILRARNHCNWIWLENLNLRGKYKAVIMDYIEEKYPDLFPLYQEIYTHKNRSYWEAMDNDVRRFASELGLEYVTNDDSMERDFDAPPVIVNYFYHEQIKKSARKEALQCLNYQK